MSCKLRTITPWAWRHHFLAFSINTMIVGLFSTTATGGPGFARWRSKSRMIKTMTNRRKSFSPAPMNTLFRIWPVSSYGGFPLGR
ncbi:hypothetical protein K437DRAFT_113789 [Tilletiaria anomala UBC 951]|uniref:Uncharacterized protein n=1 Tax=Tilletiaria anomala (strain ATCC 24038 / CBS 436.72 / UBC 951) TaxID=1037660 RepID=A0A066W055_TILAU|nr:uncharacterized protein K437DRAFT_113789 [Tilletiaria anomala UBC 951]KDN45903.1 hypothetical protein K437DRAFT_113789 [Tilletiaria anomala UBC 951]